MKEVELGVVETEMEHSEGMGKEEDKRPLRILVCDDDPAFRKLVRTYLRQGLEKEGDRGYRLIEAGSKDEIEHALATEKVDIIFLDILMPEKSGMEWLQEIVEKGIAPVVMLTGFGSEEIAVQSIHEGAMDYIPKDHLTKDRLLGTIKAALEAWKRKQAEEERNKLMYELEAKNTELERFTYTVSHDLRSPLLTIRGFVSMLEDDIESGDCERVKKTLHYIDSAAAKMERLLNDTLQLSRIGRGANPPEDVPFAEIVDDALEQTANQILESGAKVTVAENFPIVHVDRMRIAEVLVNLITNSIKYRGEQKNLEIEIGYRGEGVFFVRDNGMGIDKSQQEKVFELFYKVDSGSEGTGAGLAIVKRIIEVHNGRIWIESEPGKGCTVCFTLPVVSGDG